MHLYDTEVTYLHSYLTIFKRLQITDSLSNFQTKKMDSSGAQNAEQIRIGKCPKIIFGPN